MSKSKVILWLFFFYSTFLLANTSLAKLCKSIVDKKNKNKKLNIKKLKEYRTLIKTTNYYEQLLHLGAEPRGYYYLKVLQLLPFSNKNIEKIFKSSNNKHKAAIAKVIIAKEKEHLRKIRHMPKKKMLLKNKKFVKELLNMCHNNILDQGTKGSLIKLLARYQLSELIPILEKKTTQKERNLSLFMAINACSFYKASHLENIAENLFKQLKQAHRDIKKYTVLIRKEPKNRKYRSLLQQEKRMVGSILGLRAIYDQEGIVRYILKSYELKEYLFSFTFSSDQEMAKLFQKNGLYISTRAKIEKEKRAWHIRDSRQRFLLKKMSNGTFQVYKKDFSVQQMAISALFAIKNNRLKRNFNKAKSVLLDYLIYYKDSFLWEHVAQKTRTLLKKPELKTIADFKAQR